MASYFARSLDLTWQKTSQWNNNPIYCLYLFHERKMYVLEVKNTRQWKTTLIVQKFFQRAKFSGGVLPIMAQTGGGGGHRRQGYFFWIYVYEKVGISLVGAQEKLGKAVISSVKRPKMANSAFYGCEKVEKAFWFSNLLIF